jgi:hypothetical protein
MSKPDEPFGPSAGVRDREQELARTFVMLADSLVEDYDIVDLLDRLAAACVRLLGVTAAGLLLDDQQGRLGIVASSRHAGRASPSAHSTAGSSSNRRKVSSRSATGCPW